MIITRNTDFAGFTMLRANWTYDIAIETKLFCLFYFIKSFYDIINVFVVFFQSAGRFRSNEIEQKV